MTKFCVTFVMEAESVGQVLAELAPSLAKALDFQVAEVLAALSAPPPARHNHRIPGRRVEDAALDVLLKAPKKTWSTTDVGRGMAREGYAVRSASSALSRLVAAGLAERVSPTLYRIKPQPPVEPAP